MALERRLAENMKRLRRERGWSQEELADRVGRHRTFISQIERATKSPTLDTLERIADAFGVKIGELVD
jgi:transcriptional regulator with XRE-family HTH domain